MTDTKPIRRIAIIGTGVQGRAHAHAIAATRELTGIRLAGRDLARTRAAAAALAGQLDVPVSAPDDVAAYAPRFERLWRANGDAFDRYEMGRFDGDATLVVPEDDLFAGIDP